MRKKRYQADAKKKAIANVIDEKAINITKAILPSHWTIREYKPDYGIDLAIETFDDSTLETLGEHFFVQVKGQEKIKKSKKNIKTKNNTYSFDVIKFSLETDLLVTVQRMGHACPVMLFVVDVSNNRIYFINLNDYIDKILIPQNIDFIHQKSITIYIPVTNVIEKEKDSEQLFFYSKRGKFYSLFETVLSQISNLSYISSLDEYLEKTKKYANILLSYDILSSKNSEKYFMGCKKKLEDISNDCKNFISKNLNLNKQDKEWEIDSLMGLYTELEKNMYIYVKTTWDELNVTQGIHEDCWRKCYLPTDYNAMVQQ